MLLHDLRIRFAMILLLPSVVLVVPFRSETVDIIYAQVNHTLQLSLTSFQGEGLRQWGINEHFSPNVNPIAEGTKEETAANHALPVTCRGSHLGVG